MVDTLVDTVSADSVPDLAIVLVGPQLGQNIGFCARAMLNFGLTDLRLVAPRDGWPNADAVAPASGAQAVIEQARVFDTLPQALADRDVVLATTARPRGLALPVLTPRAMPDFVQSKAGCKPAVLFGREASGLSTDEVAQAQGILQVPLNPDFSSLNLAQAVLLVAYEWYQAGHTAVSSQAAPAASAPASQAAFDGFMVRLIQQLEDTRFLALPDKRPSVERKLRTLFAKANLSEAELGMLHGMIKALAEDGHKTR